jgi:diguanylate cyclase (GGDEF)-like protein/PAS domain S-box-containing protein
MHRRTAGWSAFTTAMRTTCRTRCNELEARPSVDRIESDDRGSAVDKGTGWPVAAVVEETAGTDFRRFRMLAELAADVLVEIGSGGVTRWVSPSLTEVLGWRPADWVGRRTSEFIHPDDVERARSAVRKAAGSGEGRDPVPVRFATADGGWRWISSQGRALRDETGTVVGGIDALRDVQREVAATQALEQERAHLLSVLDLMIDPHVLFEPVRGDDGAIVDFAYAYVNPAASGYLDLPPAALLGHGTVEIFGVDALVQLPALIRVMKTGEPVVVDSIEYTPELFGKAPRAFDIRIVKVGEQLSYTWRDVTDRTIMTRELVESEERFRLLAENSSDVIFRGAPDSSVQWLSPAVHEVLGFTPAELIGRRAVDLLVDEDREQVTAVLGARGGPRVRQYEARFVTKSGEARWMGVTVRPLYEDHRLMGWVGSARDIQAEHDAREAAEYVAAHDELTQALNRRAVIERMDKLLAHPPRSSGQRACLYVDLDGLKAVNDSLGHTFGDSLLIEVVQRVTDTVRSDDVVGRIGGDEFVVLLASVDGPDGASAVAEKIRRAVAEPVEVDGRSVVSTTSIGIALAHPHETIDELMREADLALLQAKALGGNRIELFGRPTAVSDRG